MMGNKSGVHKLAWLLVIVGGLNWLIFGLFGTDIGSWLGGMDTVIAKVIYILVGVSALYLLFAKMGSGGSSNMNMPR